MNKLIILVTGGARSGKSTYAESLLSSYEDVVYLATANVEDREMAERIERHKKSRPLLWRTVESGKNLYLAIEEETYYLLDCLTVLTSNIMFSISKDETYIDMGMQKQIYDAVIIELESLVKKIKDTNKMLVMVTNEVGLSLVPEHHVSRVYRDILGKVNQKAAELSDEVYFVVSGIPIKIKEK